MVNIESLKNAGLNFDEIQDIIESEQDFEKNGISYDLEEAFEIIKNNLFSKKDNKLCIK